MNDAYIKAKLIKAHLEERVELTSKVLRAIPGTGTGLMGLNPERVRLSPEYRAAKVNFDVAFAALRDFNGKFNKLFAAEIKAEQRERYKT